MKRITWCGFAIGLLASAAFAETPNYLGIFQANNAAYQAYWI